MATPDAIGTASCGNCTRPVYVRKNRGSFAYYRCEHCTFEGRFHNLKNSEAFIKGRVKLEAEPEPQAGKKPEKPEPPRTPQPSASGVTVAASKEDATVKPLQKPARQLSAAEKFLYGDRP